MQRKDFIEAVEQYSKETGLKPSTICQYAIQNRKFFGRVCGGYFHEDTAEKVLSFIEAHRAGETSQLCATPASMEAS